MCDFGARDSTYLHDPVSADDDGGSLFARTIPLDVEIQSVELTLTVTGGNVIGNELALHRLNSDWGEGEAVPALVIAYKGSDRLEDS